MGSAGDATHARSPYAPDFGRIFFQILSPERPYVLLAIAYGVGVSLLSLAVPISVQMLINTVAYTGLAGQVGVLAFALFSLLLISGLLNALRIHLMEIYGRRFYARIVAEIGARAVYARDPYFADSGRADLFNRYFDIVTVQKSAPELLVGGFTIILQAAVGFVVVSLYHPMFLVFNILFIIILWTIWAVWGRSAIRSGFALSHAKYETGRWLQELGAANGFYRSDAQIADALRQTDEKTKAYVEEHKLHFRQTFSQVLALLFLYAAASAALLGLGGWLVIEGQLTLGQLVAAELILSAIFAGVAQLGTYLGSFYDLCAAIDELSLFFTFPLDEPKPDGEQPGDPADLVFEQVHGVARGEHVVLNVSATAGARLLACSHNHAVQRLFVNILKRHEQPRSGWITLGGVDISELDPRAVRRDIVVLDRPSIVPGTMRDYIEKVAGAGVSANRITDALRVTGLLNAVAMLPDGLDTEVQTTGWPLSSVETMQLKLAAAIVARPKVLILTQLFDMLPEDVIARSVDALQADCNATVIYFSNRSSTKGFDTYLYFGAGARAAAPPAEEFRTLAQRRFETDGADNRAAEPTEAV